MTKIPHLYLDRHGSYSFRARFPVKISRLCQRAELRIPLRTASRSEAKRLAAYAFLAYQQFLSGVLGMEPFDQAELDRKIEEMKLQIREREFEIKHLNLQGLRLGRFNYAVPFVVSYLTDELLASYGLTPDDRSAVCQRALPEFVVRLDDIEQSVGYMDRPAMEREFEVREYFAPLRMV